MIINTIINFFNKEKFRFEKILILVVGVLILHMAVKMFKTTYELDRRFELYESMLSTLDHIKTKYRYNIDNPNLITIDKKILNDLYKDIAYNLSARSKVESIELQTTDGITLYRTNLETRLDENDSIEKRVQAINRNNKTIGYINIYYIQPPIIYENIFLSCLLILFSFSAVMKLVLSKKKIGTKDLAYLNYTEYEQNKEKALRQLIRDKEVLMMNLKMSKIYNESSK